MKPHVKRAIVRYLVDNGAVNSADEYFQNYLYAVTGSTAADGEGLARRILLALYRDGTLTRWESLNAYNGRNAMRMTKWYVYDLADKSAANILVQTFTFDDRQLLEYVSQYNEQQQARRDILIKSRAASRAYARLNPIYQALKENTDNQRLKRYEFARKHVGTTYIPCDVCGQETMTLDTSNRRDNYMTAFVCHNCGAYFSNIQDPRPKEK